MKKPSDVMVLVHRPEPGDRELWMWETEFWILFVIGTVEVHVECGWCGLVVL